MDSRGKQSASLRRQNELMSKIDSMTGYSAEFEGEPLARTIGASSSVQSRPDPRHNTTEHIELREAILSKSLFLKAEEAKDQVSVLVEELEGRSKLVEYYRGEVEEKQKELEVSEKQKMEAEDECSRLTKKLEDADNELRAARDKRRDLDERFTNQTQMVEVLKSNLKDSEAKLREIEDELRNREKLIRDYEREQRALKAEVERLGQESLEKDEIIERLNAELDKLKKKSKGDNDRFVEELRAKEIQLADANEYNGNLEVKLDQMEGNMRDIERENAKLRKQVETKDKSIDEMKNQIEGIADKYKEINDSYDKFREEAEVREADCLSKIEEAKKENERTLDALSAAVVLLHKINEASKKCCRCLSDNSIPIPSGFGSEKVEGPARRNLGKKEGIGSLREFVLAMLGASDELSKCLTNLAISKGETDLSRYAEQFYNATGDSSLDVPVFNDLLGFASKLNEGIKKRLDVIFREAEQAGRLNEDFQNKASEKIRALEAENKTLQDELNHIDDLAKVFHSDNVDTAKKMKQEKGIDLTSRTASSRYVWSPTSSRFVARMLPEEEKGPVVKPELPLKSKDKTDYDIEGRKQPRTSQPGSESSNESSSSGDKPSQPQVIEVKREGSAPVPLNRITSQPSFKGKEPASNISEQSPATPMDDFELLNEPSVMGRVVKALELGTTIKDNTITQMKNAIDMLQNEKKKLEDSLRELRGRFDDQEEIAERLHAKYSSLTIELQTSASSASLFRKEVDRLSAANKQLKEKCLRLEEDLTKEKIERRRVAESRLDLAQKKTEAEEKMAESIRRGIKSCGIDRSKSVTLHVASPAILEKTSERLTTQELKTIVGSIEKALNDSQSMVGSSVATSAYRTPRPVRSGGAYGDVRGTRANTNTNANTNANGARDPLFE